MQGVQEKKVRNLRVQSKNSWYINAKYFFNYIIAAFTIILFSPLFIAVAILIKLDSPGPVFFKQLRYGLGGKPIRVFKFRTMIDGAHELQHRLSHLNEMEGGKLFKSDKDPRITKLGRFLRKTSIDELPQLFNILRGEMSIIGPRPISTPLEDYDEEDLVRFKVKPGLGCIWQAYFRKETDFKSWMKTDAIYVENVSLLLDIKLFFTITFNVFIGKGAR
ncbi:MAG: sugar transferase [Balneolaceae bacterium]|nr:sugar transferase [Balneolaceae bacterium]